MDDYDVFLNYRSLDARDFVSHLYVALKSAGLGPFMARRCFAKGVGLKRSIDAALEVARVHVAVVSGRYAESKYCLRILVAMLRSGKPVIPVFYDVEPWDLRLVEKGLLAAAFGKHKQREPREQVEEWADALRKLAGINGFRFRLNDDNRDEAAFVQTVVDAVQNWLGLVPSTLVSEASAAMNDYGVFINHHGRDVRGCFASHLYAALQSAGLSPFLEKESLVMADDGLRSTSALEMAKVHVALVSKGYAESKLCLSELVAMMRSGKPVIPVFYDVEVWQLRDVEEGLFAAAFGKHKQREPREQVEEWADALRKLADISGFRFRLNDDDRDAAEVVQEVVDTIDAYPKDVISCLSGLGGPCSVNAGHDYSECSVSEWTSTRSDGLGLNDSAQVGNAAAMEKLDLYFRLGEDCLGAVQRVSSHKFNEQQCGNLADKLQMVVRSASLYLNVLRGDLGSSMDVAKVVEVFRFLLALAKQIESFVQGCCKDPWIQSAMTLTNVWEYVASVGFNLELCRVAFCMECAATRCLTLDEVEEIHKVEVEVVKKKAFSDVDALSQKILLEGPSMSNENKDLAFYLLQRLNQVKPIPGAILELSEGSTAWFGRLSEWVKPCEQLGRGASGTVHKAIWLGTPVARKTFDGKENPDFMKEVEILSALSHPNVMSIFCSGKTSRGCCSIIMELMHEDLHILMERRLGEKNSPSFGCPSPFPILGAVDIMLQIGEGGKYLHDQKIVHRDLKSMNILTKNLSGEELDGYVHVKVADFGLSKTKEKSIRYSSWTYNVGSSRWMAPEIIRLGGSDQGSSSRIEGPKHPFKRDIYSFGMVCFEILTGHVPFPIHDEREVKRRVLRGERPELPKDPHKCPPPLKELIESCWSSNPEERPTFMAICSALKYLKYLLMRSCETIRKPEQSRLSCADVSGTMGPL